MRKKIKILFVAFIGMLAVVAVSCNEDEKITWYEDPSGIKVATVMKLPFEITAKPEELPMELTCDQVASLYDYLDITEYQSLEKQDLRRIDYKNYSLLFGAALTPRGVQACEQNIETHIDSCIIYQVEITLNDAAVVLTQFYGIVVNKIDDTIPIQFDFKFI